MRLEDQERIRKLQIFSQAREETFQSLSPLAYLFWQQFSMTMYACNQHVH